MPEDELGKDSDDSTFTKPLKQFNKESSNVAHVSSLRSEYFDKFEQSPVVMEIKSNGALVKSILAEFEKNSEIPEKETAEKTTIDVDIDSVIEENYMTMTPKKNVLGPRSSTNSEATVIFNDIENDENHYVEMTQNADASLLASSSNNSEINEQQPYEMVCFTESRLEPVYMELKVPEKNSDKDALPDILMGPKRKKSGVNKSDSSDADDEASKDLDSLDTPSQPRFSLSDTFRPASYYLGCKSVCTRISRQLRLELVSPPPIPSSPPPLDDLDNAEEYNFGQDKSRKDETFRYNLLARLQVNRNSDQFFNSANKGSKNSEKYTKGSTQSLDTKKESLYSPGNKSGDVSSVCSGVTDTDRQYGSSRMSHNSDSDVELRITKAAEYENMLKRRPVSEEFCNELESTFNKAHSSDMGRYLDNFQIETKSIRTDKSRDEEYLPHKENDKFITRHDSIVRRSHSLEGLLENVLSENVDTNITVVDNEFDNNTQNQTTSEGSYLWEEDSIWRERLRSASQRHTKSMEDLDSIGDTRKKQKKAPRGISRGVTYVNDNFFKPDKHQKEQENNETKSSKNEIKKEGSFIIDREKLRQWDLLSSAPSDDQLSTTAAQVQEGNNLVVELGEGNCGPTESSNTQEAASGSISINTRDMAQLNARDTFPRAISAKKIWSSNTQPLEARSVTNLNRTHEGEHFGMPNAQGYYHQIASEHDLPPEAAHQINTRKTRPEGWNTYKKLEQIKQHLLELEKQYEKGKPLVNLVDNMVKLGSLYRVPTDRPNLNPYIRDRLEFNQQIQERRLLAEEKREWNRLNPNHFHLQEKVQQLYQLDRLIHEESGTLQNLQQDKEDIERALGGLRHRLTKGFNDPAEVEQARKQQVLLENELSRVHLMLAQNSKKLEETVAGNARLEQELLVLKQKLQTTRQQRSSQQYSNASDSLTCAMGNSAMLESDLHRVQKKNRGSSKATARA
ncbi:hypothetical protein NQ318_006138 [Aromia moschata]|uniref:Pleckstrin homology domain-containing protein n=1 Tax=Aromia moschata TaxID=1265417 RepID=A0AAV8XMZ0_9CUCU|nr:hypothetical protein NQ318_006138 [Aromia moschata]